MVIMMGVIIYSLNFNNSKKNNSEKKVVAVTIVPEQAFVEAVCGDLVDVVVMVPPGSSPENYEPTSQQMTALSDAELYFSIGVPTEKANILPKVNDLASNINVISLNNEVSKVYADRTFDSGERDPHIWLSPKRVIVMINTIAEKMIKIDPENKEVYESNAKQYIAIVFISILFEAFPFIMLGVIVSSVIHEFVPDDFIPKIMPKNPFLGAIVGVIMGLFIPVCDCAVIPISRRLIKKEYL